MRRMAPELAPEALGRPGYPYAALWQKFRTAALRRPERQSLLWTGYITNTLAIA